MLIKHHGGAPVVDPSVFVAPTAVLVGKVSVGLGGHSVAIEENS
jgi:carbonic anhydrase/acetyltransferase-like protein (isoleucine patch superfamily)